VSDVTGIRADASNVEFLLRIRDEESDLLQTWRSSAKASSSFLGSFDGNELVEFMQMLEFNTKSGTLKVASLRLRGQLLVHEGRIVKADVSPVTSGQRRETTPVERGHKAVRRLLGLPRGDFEFVPGNVALQAVMDLKISQALMERMRVQDETGRHPRPDA